MLKFMCEPRISRFTHYPEVEVDLPQVNLKKRPSRCAEELVALLEQLKAPPEGGQRDTHYFPYGKGKKNK